MELTKHQRYLIRSWRGHLDDYNKGFEPQNKVIADLIRIESYLRDVGINPGEYSRFDTEGSKSLQELLKAAEVPEKN